MMEEWTREIQAAGQAALDTVRTLPSVPSGLESVVGRGESWAEAVEDVEWDDGDVLVVGSSALGPVARVFLGSRASKIVRHSPVPVVVSRAARRRSWPTTRSGRRRSGAGHAPRLTACSV